MKGFSINMKRVVLALGGNALGNNLEEQVVAVKSAAKAIADLVEAGLEVVVAHGNGPQVGMLSLAFATAQKADDSFFHIPLPVCIAMTQGYIGSDIQNAVREELLSRNINKPVATVVTHTLVDGNDPAFSNPTKPIGAFYTKEEADEMTKQGYDMVDDAGRGWRQVVASPKPIGIVETETVRTLLEAGQLPIAVGGGGVPVKKVDGNHLESVAAVVDKDFASAKLAEELDADMLIILTAVEWVALNFQKPDQVDLSTLTVAESEKYIPEGHFWPGSMLPKVQGAVSFVRTGKDRKALITLLTKASDGIKGKTGTIITN